MTRHRSFALLIGLIAVVALVCATIFAAFAALGAGSGPAGDRVSGPGTQQPAATGADSVLGRTAPLPDRRWTGSWAAAPAGAEPGAPHGFPGRSLRNVVHTSIGGSHARITLSNRYSATPLLIGHASIAVSASGGDSADAVPGTMRRVTFGHRRSVTVPPGGRLTSDPVRLSVPADADLLVTLYTPGPGGPVTYHPRALQTSYLARGDHTESSRGTAYHERTSAWRYLTGVDVLDPHARGAVVTFGDSITDGQGSRPGADHRWPDVLADRLGGRQLAVLNAGISGNRVLRSRVATRSGESGISRFRRDVLDQAGVTAVVIDLGVNDILSGRERDPARITAGLRNLTRQARARGLRVVGTTLTPFGGSGAWSSAAESVRTEVNRAIRGGRIFDAYVDFDRTLRDPYAPRRLHPAYDSGDGLHPSDAGYRALGRAIDPRKLLGGPTRQGL